MSEESVPTYPLTQPWFETPFFGELLAQSDLDETLRQQVQQYARDGYLVFDPGIEDFDARAAAIIENLADKYALAGNAGNSPYVGDRRRIQDAWRFDENVRALACEPRVLELLQQIYRRGPIPFQTLNFPIGTEQKSHSDSIHFNSIPGRFMCGVWLALEDIDGENGPLHYYPGSHKLPHFEMYDFGITATKQPEPNRYHMYEASVAKVLAASGLERREVQLKKGQALLWASNLYHGGSPIRDKTRTRHSQVNHFFFEDCLYYTPVCSDLPLGKVYWRSLIDVRTGEGVPSRYNHEDVTYFPGNINPDPTIQPSPAGPAPRRTLGQRIRRFVARHMSK